MKRLIALFLIIAAFASITSVSYADNKVSTKTLSKLFENEDTVTDYYVIGSDENTFNGLYKRMCVNLDLKKNPIPVPDTEIEGYNNGEYEYARVMKDDDESYEYIGYVRSSKGTDLYIVWNWTGFHKDGSIIGMVVYYQLDGKYLGNIQRDYSAGTSTSSHKSPYFVPGEPMNKD